ncbi:MAG: reverse transcriptase domain-containing protein [Nitrosomonadaceae bacterium]
MMAHNYNTRVRVPAQSSPRGTTDSPESNDAAHPNPQGRCTTENGGNKGNKFVNCKNVLKISTFNVRTIREQRLREELTSNCVKQNIDVIGIQEHRIVHEEEIRYENIQGRTLITSSAWRNSAGAATGGVGILLNTKAAGALSSVIRHDERILVATFQGNPATTIIITYCPTNTTDDDTTEHHYEKLRGAIETTPAHNMLLVTGDFNAHVGREDATFSYHETTNRNGKTLVDFTTEMNLEITNVRFRKKEGKQWTYIGPAGNKSQIDFILVNKKWRNSILNVEPYNTFASVGSDHRIVTANVRLSLRKSKRTPRRDQYDWEVLKNNQGIQQAYTIEVKNQFNILQDMTETGTEKYQRFIDANKHATENIIPIKPKKNKNRFSEDPRVIEAREKTKIAFDTYHVDTSEYNRLGYETAKHDLETAYEIVTEEDLCEKVRQVEIANINCKHGKSWALINDITGRKTSMKGQLKGNTSKERIENWYKHFQNLLGSAPVVDDESEEIETVLSDVDIKEGPFTKDEYNKVKESLTEGKACGEDGIPPEVLKRCDLDDIILDFCNKALIDEEIPRQWTILNIIPIPKGGDLSLGGSYRGISLSSLVAKAYNKMMLNRIKLGIDHRLRVNQNGFRSGRTTTSHILALRRLIEGIKKKNLPAILTFIDFRKAFDTIHRGKMLKILTAYGIPDQLVTAIGNVYNDTRAKVISPDGETEIFEILAGVLQGDTLAPYLFVIVLDYALRKAIDGREEDLGFRLVKRMSRRVKPIMVTDCDFADDIALLSEEIDQAQELLNRVEVEAGKIGLKINPDKTKFITYNQQPLAGITTINGARLESVNDFKYLGSWINSTEKDIKVRKALAWKACNKMTKIWKSKLKRNLKIRIFQATVESVLLYGCEAWTLTNSLEKGLDGCYTRLLRTALNISWKQHLTNSQLYSGLSKITERIKERRLRFTGHCYRRNDELVSSLILWEPKHGTVNRGRPTTTFINKLAKDTGLETEDLHTAMTDRAYWADIVKTIRTRCEKPP